MTAEKDLPSAEIQEERKPVTSSDLFNATAALGSLFFSAFLAIGKAVAGTVLGILAAIERGWARVSRVLLRVIKKIIAVIITPFIRYRRAMRINRSAINRAKAEKGAFGGAAAALKTFGRFLLGKRGVIITVTNWVLPVVSCIFLFNVISYANNQAYALRLTVNGNFIGYIDDESIFNSAEKIVQKRINFTGSSTAVIVFEPSYEVGAIGYGPTLNTNQLTDKMLELIDADIADGYGMYIGEDYYGTLSSHEKVDISLAETLDKYRSNAEKETVAFDKEITFIPGKYMVDSFVEEQDMIKLLTSYKKVASYYTVVDGDSPAAICRKVNMTYEELAPLNNGFNVNTPVHGGDQIKITSDEPFLTVIVTREEHYNEVFPYETVYRDDASIYKDDKIIRTPGVNGSRAVVANVSYINGVEVNRHVLSRTVTKEPITQIVSLGIKPRTGNTAPAQTVQAGKYLWPVGGNTGKISCLPYMARGNYRNSYYGHTGLDIAGTYATPIYAAATGTVIFAGWDSYGLGNCVKIQHDDGKVTVYGHMSSLSAPARVGKRVTMGECIGYMGSTGNSTGNHLHFEVRINGIAQWPPDYLPPHLTQWGTYI